MESQENLAFMLKMVIRSKAFERKFQSFKIFEKSNVTFFVTHNKSKIILKNYFDIISCDLPSYLAVTLLGYLPWISWLGPYISEQNQGLDTACLDD